MINSLENNETAQHTLNRIVLNRLRSEVLFTDPGKRKHVCQWVGRLIEHANGLPLPVRPHVLMRRLLQIDRVYFRRLEEPHDLVAILDHCREMLADSEEFNLYLSRRTKLDLLRDVPEPD